jgi:hypothetical protein
MNFCLCAAKFFLFFVKNLISSQQLLLANKIYSQRINKSYAMWLLISCICGESRKISFLRQKFFSHTSSPKEISCLSSTLKWQKMEKWWRKGDDLIFLFIHEIDPFCQHKYIPFHKNKNYPFLPLNNIFSLSFCYFFIYLHDPCVRYNENSLRLWQFTICSVLQFFALFSHYTWEQQWLYDNKSHLQYEWAIV